MSCKKKLAAEGLDPSPEYEFLALPFTTIYLPYCYPRVGSIDSIGKESYSDQNDDNILEINITKNVKKQRKQPDKEITYQVWPTDTSCNLRRSKKAVLKFIKLDNGIASLEDKM